VSLVALLVHFVAQAQRRGGTIEIDEAEPLQATFKVDLNTAAWQEIAELPGIGESLAKKITEERTSKGPFQDTADGERRVKGVGGRTLEKLKPFLRPFSKRAEPAGGSSG